MENKPGEPKGSISYSKPKFVVINIRVLVPTKPCYINVLVTPIEKDKR